MARLAMGKGLDALFNDHIDATTEKEGFVDIRLSEIEPNRNQPRKDFDKEQLEALSNSIKIHGVIQPILVCPGRKRILYDNSRRKKMESRKNGRS